MTQIRYRQARAEDRAQLLELFERLRPAIARLSCRSAYKAVIDDALHARRVVIFVASLDDVLVGYVIAAWSWAEFKRGFILRHPEVGLALAVRRAGALLGRRRHGAGPGSAHQAQEGTQADDAPVGIAWEDSAETIAKVIHVGVDPKARSRGVGRGLYAGLIAHLRERGFTRIDARIDQDNTASIQMHEKRAGR